MTFGSTTANATTNARLLHLGQAGQQDVKATGSTETDTLVEPDIALSPLDSRIAVAAAHDGRDPISGALAIDIAYTHDGGGTWHHAPLPKLTKATGGAWDRASDPVVAFDADGSVYVSTLVFMTDTCPTGVAVSKSTDGGKTFAPPVVTHESKSCSLTDDKNWLVIDKAVTSKHFGRLYQFWSEFLTGADGGGIGSPQNVNWSDNGGKTWSKPVRIDAKTESAQNSQPVVLRDGTVVDVYSIAADGGDGAEAREHREAADASITATPDGGEVFAVRSTNGGTTWSKAVRITHDLGDGAEGFRCCLASATLDPVTGRAFALWPSTDASKLELSTSLDAVTWSTPVLVNHDVKTKLQHVNADVTAYGGKVFVQFGTVDPAKSGGRYVQQQYTESLNSGGSFGDLHDIGSPSDTNYAAKVSGTFFGDYIGSASASGVVYFVWCHSAKPKTNHEYHQTLFAAVLAS